MASPQDCFWETCSWVHLHRHGARAGYFEHGPVLRQVRPCRPAFGPLEALDSRASIGADTLNQFLQFQLHLWINKVLNMRLSEVVVVAPVSCEMSTTAGAPLFSAAATTVLERVGQSGPQDLAESCCERAYALPKPAGMPSMQSR